MEKFTFVILNYQSTNETVECIKCILKQRYKEKNIVVVDNDSCDGENLFNEIKKVFHEEENIFLLKSNCNGGYAKGNNIGIDYAKNKLKSDFVCIINPDITILSGNFIEKSINLFKKHEYTLLGPEIMSHGININPLGGYHESVFRCIYAVLDNIRIYYTKKLRLKRFNPFKRKKTSDCKAVIFSNGENNTKDETYILNKNMKKQLSGACLIFSPLFLKEFSGFCKDTFLYCEESILAFVLYNLGYKVMYSSELKTAHKGGVSLKNTNQDEDQIRMAMSKSGAWSCIVEAKVFSKRRDPIYLKNCLNPVSLSYKEIG